MSVSKTSIWIEKTLKNAATIKTGTAPTEKFTIGLYIVCLSLNGGAEYATPARIPTKTKTVTSCIPVIALMLIDAITKMIDMTCPIFPRFFVYSDLRGSDFTSMSTSYTLFMASTPLHPQNAIMPKYIAPGKLAFFAIRNVDPMAIMNSMIPLSMEMNLRNPFTLRSISLLEWNYNKSFCA